jgi:hypothetical protein
MFKYCRTKARVRQCQDHTCRLRVADSDPSDTVGILNTAREYSRLRGETVGCLKRAQRTDGARTLEEDTSQKAASALPGKKEKTGAPPIEQVGSMRSMVKSEDK